MVFCKNYIFVVVLSVLVLIAKQSDGKEDAISSCVQEFDSELGNEEYKRMHANAFKTIDDVNEAANAALERVSAENEKNAIKELQKGYVDSIKCVAVAGYQVYKTNQEVRESADGKGSKQKIKESNANSKKTIGAAGLAAYQKNGAATEMAGKDSKQQLRKSIMKITSAGQLAYSGLDVAEDLGLLGIDMGPAAKEQSLNASSKAVENAGAGTYEHLKESALIAFGAIDKSVQDDSEDTSSGNEAARESSEASSAIESVRNAAQSKDSSPKEAVTVVKDGIIAAIKGIASAMKKPQEALKSAQKSESSKKSIREVIEQAEDDVAYAAAYAYQGIGMAGQKVGGEKKDQMLNAMSIVEGGRAAAYAALQDANYLAMVALENGQTTRETGINAAMDALLAGAFVAYDKFENAANIAFDVLNS